MRFAMQRLVVICVALAGASISLAQQPRLTSSTTQSTQPATQPANSVYQFFSPSDPWMQLHNTNRVFLVDPNSGVNWIAARAQDTVPLQVFLDQKQFNDVAIDLYTVAKQGTAYLGVGVEPPGDTLRAQLKLPEGAGLVVNYVDENGPSKDSVHKHDVLQKLDDQILVNGEQLVTLVRMHQPDQRITLTVIREAQPVKVEVKLGRKSESPQDVSLNGVNRFYTTVDNSTSAQLNDLYAARVYLNQPNNAAVPGLGQVPYVGKLFTNNVRPITFNDGDLLACIDAEGNLLAVDVKTGKVEFRGPIASKEQWSKVPQAVRDKLESWKEMIQPRKESTDQNAADKEESGGK